MSFDNCFDAIEAIETELGTDPAGTEATVKARFTTLESFRGCVLYRTTSQSLTTGVETAMSWDGEYSDNYAMHSGGNPTRITIPSSFPSGMWEFQANVWLDNTGTTAYGLFRVNGGSGFGYHEYGNLGGGPVVVAAIAQIIMGATDYVEYLIFHNSATDRNTSASGLQNVSVTAKWLGTT